MTDANKRINPLHFVSAPADIRIWSNVEIWIGIPDHFCLRLWPLQRFALSEHSLVVKSSLFYLLQINAWWCRLE